MLNPRLLFAGACAVLLSASDCGRATRQVSFHWELPQEIATGTVLPDSMREGKFLLIRSDTLRFRDCGPFRAYDLRQGRSLRAYAVYVGLRPAGGRSLEVLLADDPQFRPTADSIAALTGRMVTAALGVALPAAPPIKAQLDTTRLSWDRCVAP